MRRRVQSDSEGKAFFRTIYRLGNQGQVHPLAQLPMGFACVRCGAVVGKYEGLVGT